MAENAEVGASGDGSDNETVKRSPSRKSSRPTGYLISLQSNADSALFEKRWAHLIILIIVEAFN